jgi:hypothetical protein
MAIYNSRPSLVAIKSARTLVQSRVVLPSGFKFGFIRIRGIQFPSSSTRSRITLRSFPRSLNYLNNQAAIVRGSTRYLETRYASLIPRIYPSRASQIKVNRSIKSPEYTLAEAFGIGALQSLDSLILQKADFAKFGLNPTWKVSDVMLALLLQGAGNFKEDRRFRIKFYRYIQILEENQAYEINSYIISTFTILTTDKFPSPKDFLI